MRATDLAEMNPSALRTSAPPAASRVPVPICFPLAGDIPVGGGHVSVLLLIQNLDRRRFRPIVAVHGHGPVRRWLEQQGVQEIAAFEPCVLNRRRVRIGDVARVGRRSWALARFLRAHQVGLVHVNDTILLGTWALAARIAGAKLLWHKRGRWNDRWLHRFWFRVADHVIAITRFAAPSAPDQKCSIIHNAVAMDQQPLDRAACRRHLLAETGFPADTHILGFFANMEQEHKRPGVFIDLVAHMAQSLPQLRVAGLLFGEASPARQAKLWQRAESLGIADRIRFMGFRYPPGRWLAGCDLLVVPGVHQGFGRTLIEAMLVGTIAVAADSGGHREIIKDGETGALAPPDDAPAFADRVWRFLTRPDEVAVLAQRAREDALDRFGVSRHVESVVEVYEALLRDASGRQPAAS